MRAGTASAGPCAHVRACFSVLPAPPPPQWCCLFCACSSPAVQRSPEFCAPRSGAGPGPWRPLPRPRVRSIPSRATMCFCTSCYLSMHSCRPCLRGRPPCQASLPVTTSRVIHNPVSPQLTLQAGDIILLSDPDPHPPDAVVLITIILQVLFGVKTMKRGDQGGCVLATWPFAGCIRGMVSAGRPGLCPRLRPWQTSCPQSQEPVLRHAANPK